MTHIGHNEKVFIMMRLLLILILTLNFQSLTKADDIRDFEIEGMSIGDSLLEYISKKEILSRNPNWFKNNEYSLAIDLSSPNYEVFELLQVAYKTKDRAYSLEGIEGYKFFDNMNSCINEKNMVVNYVVNNFSSLEEIEEKIYTNEYPDYKTKFIENEFKFNSDDLILIQCTHTTSSTINQFDLRVVLRTKEYRNFIVNKAFK